MAQPTWLECALNGAWTRERQPRIPVTVAEIVEEGAAASAEGAAILHFHAYDETTGEQRDDWQIYARIIEGLRARTDAILYPTVPGEATHAPDRFAHIRELATRGLLEWTVLDPGSVNLSAAGSPGRGTVYRNPPRELGPMATFCAEQRLHPGYAIYEPGFTRAGAALARQAGMPTPIYRFMFSDRFLWGFPPRPRFLDAHLALLAECDPGAPWMVAGLDVDLSPLLEHAASRGGGLRAGLEDAPLGTEANNAALTRAAARHARRLATPKEIRAALQPR
ncbi:3-keto-5-aminohexanoate cleavage protein [Sabulicella rubraurantiaca]|uniref:3-keto-5-aminohexanoate cleavage protein n=1 Tax=Sabulicella rubraurantiaca TaxID=2811429 RepID=UPI001A95B9DB|nr:3-keto-5-aminohexanoate cleavage protein [Sabulicella rubraurantiaca]